MAIAREIFLLDLKTCGNSASVIHIMCSINGRAEFKPRLRYWEYPFVTWNSVLERVNNTKSNPLQNYPHFPLSKKERIPRSAYYMHKIHKRVSTANNESQHISRQNFVEELNDFTKKMLGKESTRLSSEHRLFNFTNIFAYRLIDSPNGIIFLID